MKKITVFLLLIALVSCKKSDYKTYKGKIANKYNIVLTLSFNDGRATGFYFYKSKGQGLRLEGNVDDDGNIILQETVDGKRTGVINAKKIGDEINGVWKNPNTGKELDFSVKEEEFDYNQVFASATFEADKKRNEIEYKKLTGTFISKINKRSKAKIEYLGNNQLLFEIDVVSAKCAMDPYKGVAEVINLNKSVFKKDGFELIFVFEGYDLNITEKGRSNDLGAFCYPSGPFSR